MATYQSNYTGAQIDAAVGAALNPDTTLSVAGKTADAKSTGDELTNKQNEINLKLPIYCENLINPEASHYADNGYYDGNTFNSNAGYYVGELIRNFKYNMQYYYSENQYFDLGNTVIAKKKDGTFVNIGNSSTHSFTITDTDIIGFCMQFDIRFSGNAFISESNEYTAFSMTTNEGLSLTNQQKKEVNTVVADSGYIKKNVFPNLFDKTNNLIVEGKYLNSTGNYESASGYYVSHPIKVTGGTTYKMNRDNSHVYGSSKVVYMICDADGNRLGYATNGVEVGTEYFTFTPANDCYVRLTLVNSNYTSAVLNTTMVCEESSYPAEYIPYQYACEEGIHLNADQIEDVKKIANINPLYGKTLAVVGDSICYGEGYTGGYAKIIGEDNGMNVINKGVSGAKITVTGSTVNIPDMINTIPVDADYIIMEGGVNDMTMDNLGTVTNDFAGTYDLSTFCGSFEKMISDAVSRFPTKKLGYISVHRIKQWEPDSYSSWTNTGYYEKALEICKKWGIPVCDLTISIPSLYGISALQSAYTKDGDGWHPNENGYKLFYVPKITYWLKTL